MASIGDRRAARGAGYVPKKLGAKHWLFVGHPDAGPRLANLFTLVENARQAGVDIEAYLTALLTHLPDHSVRRLGEWLPRAWQQRERERRPTRARGLTAYPPPSGAAPTT